MNGVSDMKTLLLMALLFPLACMGDSVIGTATLKFIDSPDYQPGGCDILVVDGEKEECLEFTYWRRYELVGLTNVSGEELGNPNAVLASHTERGGEWFLVLEELSREEALKFGTKYKVVDGSAIFKGTCLENSLEAYDQAVKSSALMSSEGQYCYDVNFLQNNN